ncbi:biopolymer transporter ExbB [Shimia litoralis]|uniref:Biopolymer transporter ExbB n=1 Tax=Shimia litoralis TaxID=420403 RepID=A0A4U7MXW8_9RHOB|nr:biopolymer transporter ExbB [Shimia litoralis]TKZ18045.1 biopolymer transporter ExbB [Shimia litoralis]
MDQPEREAELHFSHPFRQIVLMLVVLGLTGVLAYLALPSVLPVFIANPYLNGFIVLVFVIGVVACFAQVLSLISSVRWIEGFAHQVVGHEAIMPPQLLAPLAALLRSRGARSQISATSTRSILDSVATRIDEGREITRYLVNLLIFLGLLGTFYGLATSVPAIVETIGNLAPRDGESGADVFERLQEGLQSQMGGMGIAFASSLLGLAGSLIVGLLELFAGHGQNRFYRELEEWLSSITRVGFSTSEGEGSIEQTAMAGMMDHMALQIETIQATFVQSETSRAEIDAKLGSLVEGIFQLADRMEAQAPTTNALLRVADGQEKLLHALESRLEHEGLDAESRMRLRSIDVQMLRILEEISAGRQESMAEIRTDLAALGRIMRQGDGTSKFEGQGDG